MPSSMGDGSTSANTPRSARSTPRGAVHEGKRRAQAVDGECGIEVSAANQHQVSYEFIGEDHTLGNAVRYMLMKSPDVEFAGYSVPHPGEPELNMRVQTHPEGATADQAMITALDNIMDVCDHVSKTYKKALKKYKAEAQASEPAPMDES
mmetsp:Transcript_11309/g.25753  ORF Transcript_11309/g.25753 Transcript_11309/m.25753 type:complete len:150 (+) Transcript_11309:42-491(+)